MYTPNPHRQVLRYYGSKFRIGEWLAGHHPEHYCYVSVYGGGANDIFTKPPSRLEVYNDLDHQVVTFFRALRDRPEELIRAIQLTPYSRVECDLSNDSLSDDVDEVEIARRFYVHSRQGRDSATGPWKTSWRYEFRNTRDKHVIEEWNEVEHLWAAVARLKRVQIECDEALTIIARYDAQTTLFYLDPPYPHITRYTNWTRAYRYEMTEADHIALAERLYEIEGMAIISSYPNDLYDQLYTSRGWEMRTIQARDNQNQFKTEAVWLNIAAQRGQRQLRIGI